MWELRSELVWGSKQVSTHRTREEAEEEAKRVIDGAGNHGRITYVSVETRTVYFTEYRDED